MFVALAVLSVILAGEVQGHSKFSPSRHKHDSAGANHMRDAHGVYREPSPDGINPFPLVEPDFLQASSWWDGTDDGVNLLTPAGDSIYAGSEEVAPGDTFDIAIVGMPFDTAVSFRPGARFGPSGIRHNSKRMSKFRGYNVPLGVDIYKSDQKILDCGDIPVTAFDNTLAVKQMKKGYSSLLGRQVYSSSDSQPRHGRTNRLHPKLITLGGDHTLVLPVLRSLFEAYGPVSVIHFDAHLDTWDPGFYGGSEAAEASTINHGTFFWHASQEGLIRNGSSIHAGIRTRLADPTDYDTDAAAGFAMQEAHVIDDVGTQGIIDRIRATVGDSPVYLSIDIDVLDPSAAPATGTPETGGWSSRELRKVLRGLDGLDIIGADVVEVAPSYDNQASLTQMVAADLVWELLGMMVRRGPLV